MDKIINSIRHERLIQDKKFGIQRHNNLSWLAILAEEFGEAAEIVTKLEVPESPPTPAMNIIPLQERLKKELIQTAAVCVAWLESIKAKELT